MKHYFSGEHLFARKIADQNVLDIVVASGVGIIHPNQFKSMLPADGVLLRVPPPHRLILQVLLSVQFDCQNRQLPI